MEEIFVVVRRGKTHIYLDAKSSSTVLALKKMVEGVMKVKPVDQMLVFDKVELADDKLLRAYGVTPRTATAGDPAEVQLALRQRSGEFEPISVEDVEVPEIPDVFEGPSSVERREREASTGKAVFSS